MEAEKNGRAPAILSDYQITTNTKAAVRRWIRGGRISLGIYYDFSITISLTSPRTYCVLSSRRGLLVDRFVVVSGFAAESRLWKEAVISLTVTRLKEESEKTRDRRRGWRGGLAKAFNFPLLADGGRHTPFRSELSLPENYGRRMSGWGGPNVA